MGAGSSSAELSRLFDSLTGVGAGVDFDASLVIMILLFLGMMIYLNKTLFQPYLKVKDDRHEQIEGAKAKSARMQEKAEAIFAEYEDKLTKAREEAVAERASVKEGAKKEEQAILAEARSAVDKTLEETRRTIEKDTEAAATDLDRQAQTLSKLIVDKVLAA